MFALIDKHRALNIGGQAYLQLRIERRTPSCAKRPEAAEWDHFSIVNRGRGCLCTLPRPTVP